jgi:hypothetical protein
MFKTEHVEAVYETRLEVCKGCNNYDTTGIGCSLPGTQPCCNEKTGGCGCSLSIKLRSLSTDCPLGKWKAVMSEQEEELLKANLNDKT